MVKVWPRGITAFHRVAPPELFQVLENESGLQFSAALRTAIEFTCNVYIDFHQAESNSVKWSSYRRRYEKVLNEAKKFETTMRELAREENCIDENIAEDLVCEYFRRYPNSDEKYPVPKLWAEVSELRLMIETGYKNACDVYGGKYGREPHKALHQFVSELANIFEEAGGVASAPNNPTKEKRYGPFLRFLNRIYRALPDSAQTHTETALGEHAQRVLQERKNSKVK